MNEAFEGPLPPSREFHESTAKKRKIRKGTRSCWECKRRKIRCIFPSQDDVTCIECQRRHTTCVSQDLPEYLAPARQPSNSRHLGERIARIENFINELAGSQDGKQLWTLPPREPKRDQKPISSNFDRGGSTSIQWRNVFSMDSPSAESGDEPEADSYFHSKRRVTATKNDCGVPGEKRKKVQEHPSRGPLVVRAGESIHTPTWDRTPDMRENCDVQILLSAFPSEVDARILARQSFRPSIYTHLINAQSHNTLTRDNLLMLLSRSDASSAITVHPDPNTHPVLLVRQMIVFAITLQSPSGDQVHGLSEPRGVVMHRLMKAARTYMATKEDFCGTLESLLCIMLEGIFEVNCGNLRQAWATYRRAMAAAQLMGLHRSPIPSPRRLDKHLNMDPPFLWFRIVYTDRYLSLLLGLPQGTTDKAMVFTFQDEPPLGKFERQLSIIASHILERNETMFKGESFETSLAVTHSIDGQLLEASRSMPSSFWRPADFEGHTPGSPESLLETLRLASQVYYHSLLIQLYLPHTMYSAAENSEREYAKNTCMNAGREILTRFIAHRTFNPMSSCSRPVDFFAFLAAMTILLTHLDTHRESRRPLVHQRLSDRAMLEQAADRMDIVSQFDNDAMAEKGAEMIRHLLVIEAEASEGVAFTRTIAQANQVPQHPEKNEKELRLNIPHLGCIKIARQIPSSLAEKSNEAAIVLEESDTARGEHYLQAYHDPFLELFQQDEDHTSITAGIDDWNLQGVDTAFFDSLTKGMPGLEAHCPRPSSSDQ